MDVFIGAQAEDSILLQFILDSRKILIQRRNIDDRSKNDGPEEGKFALKAHVAPLAERSPPSHELKEVNVAKCGPDWVGMNEIIVICCSWHLAENYAHLRSL